MRAIDLNCDLGESFGNYSIGCDEKIIPLADSCNIACGLHAGDPLVMRKTVKLAKEAGITIGAHPGYPDLQGFGRRDMSLSPDEAYAFVLYQLGALQAFCQAEKTSLNHVKPHGQLYNRCSIDYELSLAVAYAVRDFDPTIKLVGLANSQLIQAGIDANLTVLQEFFADRNYTDEGLLVSRNNPDAIISDDDLVIKRIKQVVDEGTVTSLSGKVIPLQADTICIHGDNEHALMFARRIREILTS